MTSRRLQSAVCLLAGLICLAATCDAYHDGFERYVRSEPTWLQGSGADGGGGRKLLQGPGHSGSSKCTVNIVGTGKKWQVASASVKCTTTDKAFTSTGVQIYAGKPLVDLYNKDDGTNFKGVKLMLPSANVLGTGNAEPVLLFLNSGVVSLTGSVSKMSVVDWAVIHIETGTNMTISNFEWSNNYGVRFPTLAVGAGHTKVSSSRWLNNNCTSPTRCHTPGAYVTEGARITITNSRFYQNRGHLAGAVMITSGALGTITGTNFTQNRVTDSGGFGGAIFHDFCTDPRTNGQKSSFTGNHFTENQSAGFGGAIRVGSPDGGCQPTISNNVFKSNHATYTGGAVDFSYCGGHTPFMSGNTYDSNTATKFNGQVGYNALVYPTGEPGAGTKTPSGAGCAKPNTVKSTWKGSAPKFCPPWFFP